MRNQNLPQKMEVAHLKELFKQMSLVLDDFAQDVVVLLHYTQSPIQTEDEVLERAKVMDELMDMATGDNDIVMIFANAISDRIEEFENVQLDLPRMKSGEVLANLMHLHHIESKDLFEIAPPNVIVELLNQQRSMTIAQVKAFSQFFHVPATIFID
ncbi:conserved hypothetical protein [Beggiatoa sp. PS]|nr:conserved hypothetical protein [Beggiatoa sp. PS]